MMDLLISKKCRKNPRDSGGNTPLHLAVEEGHGDAVRFLLEQGADPDRSNNEGNTPLDIASPQLAFLFVNK